MYSGQWWLNHILDGKCNIFITPIVFTLPVFIKTNYHHFCTAGWHVGSSQFQRTTQTNSGNLDVNKKFVAYF